ncbi:MAG: hypothetical protein A2725_01330 [Candidatus Magasanikbacteria bacterium RIFCSPHIGHO2_01_FULL_33_34]|uniref:PDZ domain-containing protein n=1 Tax=Candidatus Magasanikbacteria bacterium RIFCSPHIGHO2_01_FULL_33_34 TaxID=1798671 RepID=A0A1F6LJ65_9BACT|nr:MAG: hypothetical protein A2725_01330 [Candidatus Magasanikbacteria bacterium RIFCSPHIGHO2_01_FULL_33_34]OGH65461.1 MAG: hypothetical protein A3B83_01085 [Candidatus Magasanikbacteria bacterium RIFCSPHIGHO2_02_FULL_33_17]OGH76171.1 MAG: hypothetical protein A3A89_01905 [Candidatus Magasanikbacteria bacterium RIFCSPLOWO2_01_FULL_33_34]OGH81015.1 MAG: hypothetical protein A3F93_04520 [Candidatus Magasanikbacteria bacterium RIFCSPLOWO2_12_FULL_34_7]
MENSPPHLPAKACDLQAHRTFKSVWWLLFLVFVAGLSSVSLTLSTLVWFAPSFVPDPTLVSSQKTNNTEVVEVDLSVLNSVKKRLWYVYDTRDKINKQFYADSANKYQSVMFSSDGWAVAYVPDYRKGDEKFWEGVDYQGTIYNIEKVFVDTVSNLTYIKFDGDGFPFISFANWNDIGNNEIVWGVSLTEYQQYNFEKDLALNNLEYKIWQPQLFYLIKDDFEVGNILVNEKGEMMGMVDNDGRVIYGWLVDSQYASILQSGAPDYRAVEWTGYMVNGYVNYGGLTKRVSGFYVDKSNTKVTSSTIGVGDVITRIQNQPLKTEDLARQVLLSPDKFNVAVYRDGQEFDIEIGKNKVLIK